MRRKLPLLIRFLRVFYPRSTRPRHNRERFLFPVEWSRLRPILDAQPQKVKIYFYLLLLEGPRKSEARLMQWPHLDLEAGLWYKARTKTGHAHVLPLAPQTCRLLIQLPRHGLYVFPGCHPNVPWSPTAIRYWWDNIRWQAGIGDVRIHDLRRTMASWMTMNGENLKIVQTILDHASLSTTQIYARLDLTAVRAALARHAERVLG